MLSFNDLDDFGKADFGTVVEDLRKTPSHGHLRKGGDGAQPTVQDKSNRILSCIVYLI